MRRTSIEQVNQLIGGISFVNQNLLYHYPHYFILGDDQIQIQDDNYQIAGA